MIIFLLNLSPWKRNLCNLWLGGSESEQGVALCGGLLGWAIYHASALGNTLKVIDYVTIIAWCGLGKPATPYLLTRTRGWKKKLRKQQKAPHISKEKGPLGKKSPFTRKEERVTRITRVTRKKPSVKKCYC